jgi:hypothetical protein
MEAEATEKISISAVARTSVAMAIKTRMGVNANLRSTHTIIGTNRMVAFETQAPPD